MISQKTHRRVALNSAVIAIFAQHSTLISSATIILASNVSREGADIIVRRWQ
jgi:hypothetical protein